MPVIIDGRTYYRTAETFRAIGISRNTLYRWLQKETLTSFKRRDSRGWRLFTREEIERLNKTINSITRVDV
jgi:DNA-binding transcriptional MerR regulator